MTEPNVTVTEADRRAALEVVAPKAGALPLKGEAMAHVDLMNRVSHAIARARTMAAFEERVRCIRKALAHASGSLKVLLAAMTGADMAAVVAWCSEDNDVTDDDIRALVLKGWK